MRQHTKEPWKWEPSTKTIRSLKENYWLATMDSWDGAVNNDANAARIVACVNGCAGLNPAAYRGCVDSIKSTLESLERLDLDETLKGCQMVLQQALTYAQEVKK